MRTRIEALSNLPAEGSRREFLARAGMGLAITGLAGVMRQDGAIGRAAGATGGVGAGPTVGGNPMLPRTPHHRAKAKRVIQIFLNGGPSHVDTFDPKPSLQKHAGQKISVHLPTERPTGAAYPSPFKFEKHGRAGIDISELFSPLAPFADDLCVVRSMYAEVPNHEPSLMLMNCGASTVVRPSIGSWMTYGLGTENQNLPGFVAMCPGLPIKGAQNWQSAFLPGVFQGAHVDTRRKKIQELIENVGNPKISREPQRKMLDLTQALNRAHLAERGGHDGQLEARIHNYELAYRMQMEATDAFDIEREPAEVRERYGSSIQGRQLLIARRLAERGVRYIQVWHGDSQPWDNHDDLAVNHRKLAGECAPGVAALLGDLKDRGMLEETLVILGGEFGRTPTVELPTPGSNAGKINGRDHNHWGFSVVMAGGGIRGGHIHGATDEFGFQAVENRTSVHDLHATILHLLGFDHEKLTYRFSGRDFRLTDVFGEVVQGLLA